MHVGGQGILKETCLPCRTEREKSIVQGKLRMAQKSILESSARQESKEGGSFAEEQHILKSRIFELEEQVCK